MTKHEELLDQAKKAIDRLYSDRTVSRYETDSSLKELIDEIVIKIQALGIPG